MIQTAEGALNETHDILQRMRELATQAANDTNTDTDRGEIQKEINQLTSEINRIGNTTEFNTQKLLNGGEQVEDLTVSTTGTGAVSLTDAVKEVAGEWTISVDTALTGTQAVQIAGVTITGGDNLDVTANDDKTKQATAIAGILENDSTFSEKYTVSDNEDGSITIKERTGKASGTDVALAGAQSANFTRTQETASTAAADPKITIDTAFDAGDTLTIGDKTYTFGDNADNFDIDVTAADNEAKQADALAKILAKESGIDTAVSDGVDEVTITQEGGKGFTASFQVGANEGQSMSIEIEDMRAAALGLTGQAGTGNFTESNNVTDGTDNTEVEAALDVSTHESAAKAITVINDAIEEVSAQRSNLGAYQNRLDHTINNLSTSSENLTAAESRIRDVDYALAAYLQ
jgi:flagellin